MTTTDTLLICRTPRPPGWGVGPLPPRVGTLALVGWPAETLERASIIVAHAWRQQGTVCFTTSRPTDEPSARSASSGLLSRLRAIRQNMLTFPVWQFSRRVETIAGLFDDAGYSWWLQSQVALLLHADATDLIPPKLGAWSELLSDAWTETAAQVPHVLAALRPTVDGDCAALWAPSEAGLAVQLDALKTAAAQQGWAYEELDQDSFVAKVFG